MPPHGQRNGGFFNDADMPFVTPEKDRDSDQDEYQEEEHQTVKPPVRGPGDFSPFPSFSPPVTQIAHSQQSVTGSIKTDTSSSYSYPTTDSEANPLTNIRSANRKLDLQTMMLLHLSVAISQINGTTQDPPSHK